MNSRVTETGQIKPGGRAVTVLPPAAAVSAELQSLLDGRHHDPFQLLGRHWLAADVWVIRALIPDAVKVWVEASPGQLSAMTRVGNADVFELRGGFVLPDHYGLTWLDRQGNREHQTDPYTFPPQLGDLDLYLFGKGNHQHIYRRLGAHFLDIDGVSGVLFATWAPNAERVSVVGDFNGWDGRRHPMRNRGDGGVWELFIPGVACAQCYKFEIRPHRGGRILLKADPYARFAECRPATASKVDSSCDYQWGDQAWMDNRRCWDWQHRPMAVYEVHPGSWRRSAAGGFLCWRELAHQLVQYVQALRFTHIQLMPVAEHPLDSSWGYQCTGYYAPSSRFGEPDDFRYFVDYCHRAGIGVLIDWVAGHFPKDEHGLAGFDGSALYEHADPRQGEHRGWGTLIFNYGRCEVKNFLLANALYWLEEFHVDGLRVDAVASILYLDYSRQDGDWIANEFGGNENLDAIAFLRQLNELVHQQFPGALVIAEESTAWPQVSRPTYTGGLGFSMKWNMGWMNDTLSYFSQDPIFRRYHHQQLTFAMLYAYHENFVLALSHDEVVHGKKSLLEKMPGDDWQKFANLRLLYTYLYTWPGKKLLFMGGEFAQRNEWNSDCALDWQLLEDPTHQGIKQLLTDLNGLYCEHPPLHRYDFDARGFDWIDCNDTEQSVLSYVRKGASRYFVVVLNFTPVPRYHYRLGMPQAGSYREVFNSDSRFYGGTDVGNGGLVATQSQPWMNRPHSLSLTLPPLAGIVLAWVDPAAEHSGDDSAARHFQ